MTHDEYLRDPSAKPSLSASIAKILLTRSPRHAWLAHPRLNPDWKPEPPKEEFDIGTAAHALLLEGVNQMQVLNPADYPNQKGGGVATGWSNKAIREARDAARAAGKIPVLLDDATAVTEMVSEARAAFAHCSDLAGYTLFGDGGESEHPILWHEGDTYFRAKLDRVSTDRHLIIDFKTTECAEPSVFSRQIVNMGYDVQAAMYERAVQKPDVKFVFMVQEKETPYAVSFIGMPPAFMELGRRKLEVAIARWKTCMASGEWPGYPQRIAYVDPPAWELARWEGQ